MNLTEYNALPEGDLKLAVRLAVTMGWRVRQDTKTELRVANPDDFKHNGVVFISWFAWSPFTDASIPYGLIGQGVEQVAHTEYGYYAVTGKDTGVRWFKRVTHAIICEYNDADPLGHWTKFLKGE